MEIFKIKLSVLMLLLIVLFPVIANGEDYNSATTILLNRIALGEGTSDAAAQQNGFASGYDVLYGYNKPGDFDQEYSDKSLTEMTLEEISDLQTKMGSKSAVGRYQILSETLFGTAKNGYYGLQDILGLSDNTLFDAGTQDRLAQALLERRGYSDWIAGTISDHDFQKNLSKEWASIADPDTGKSYYGQGVGTTDAQIKEAMAQAKAVLGISQEAQNEVIILTLYVHDESAEGPIISGAHVTGQDASGNSFEETTNSDGYVTITGDSGSWSFSVSADGYETSSWIQEIAETDSKDAYLMKSNAAQKSTNSALIRIIRDHPGSVSGLEFNPDGEILASTNVAIHLWDTSDGSLIRDLDDFTHSSQSLAFSPDGNTIASGCADGVITLWDVAGGTKIRTLYDYPEADEVDCLVFSPDGNTIASGCRNGTIIIWDAEIGTVIHTLEGHTSDIRDLDFSPDGKTLVSVSFDNTVMLWDTTNLQCIRTLDQGAYDLTFSPDGKTLALSYDDRITILNVADGSETETLRDDSGSCYPGYLAFSPDGKIIISVCDKRIIYWDVASRTVIKTLDTIDSEDWYIVAFSSDSRVIAAANENDEIELWSV